MTETFENVGSREELKQLLACQETLKQELKAREKELQDAQGRPRLAGPSEASLALKLASSPPIASAAPNA